MIGQRWKKKTKDMLQQENKEDVLDNSKTELPTMEEIKKLGENAEKQSISDVELDGFGIMQNIYRKIREEASKCSQYSMGSVYYVADKSNEETWVNNNKVFIEEMFKKNGYRVKINESLHKGVIIWVYFNRDGTPFEKDV